MQNEPELEIDNDGTKAWYLNGELHRADGPAVEYANGDKEWWVNGKLHRVDGPAFESAGGNNWWALNHERFTFESWLDLTPVSSQEKIKLRLKYAK